MGWVKERSLFGMYKRFWSQKKKKKKQADIQWKGIRYLLEESGGQNARVLEFSVVVLVYDGLCGAGVCRLAEPAVEEFRESNVETGPKCVYNSELNHLSVCAEIQGKLWHTIINDMTKSVPKMAMTMKTARSERFVITRHSAVVCT